MRDAPSNRLLLMRPPYSALDALPKVPLRVEEALRGLIMIWRPDSAAKIEALDKDMARVRSRIPGVALVIVLPPPRDILQIRRIFEEMHHLRPVGILPHALRDLLRIRQLLRQPPPRLSEAIFDYIVNRGLIDNDRLYSELQQVIEASETVRSVSRLARKVGRSRRTLGRHFATSGVPSPSHWLQFLRLTRVLLTMQRDDCSVAKASAAAGYPDPFTFSNQMKRLVGVRPSEARCYLGWEWFIESWIAREVWTGGFDRDRYHHALKVYTMGAAAEEAIAKPASSSLGLNGHDPRSHRLIGRQFAM